MHIQPYLFFNGRCNEAIEFYKKVLGAEVTTLMRMKDVPASEQPPALPPGAEKMILHADIRIGDTTIMASDGRGTGELLFKGFALSSTQDDEASARRVFAALAEQGKIDMPIAETFWSPCFGMATDRFGVQWMVTVANRKTM
ncbi:MAG: VOC family protein [Rudaea sp.]